MSSFKGKVLHNALQSKLKLDFEKFDQFLEFIEDALKKEQKKVKEWVNKELSEVMEEDQASELASILYEDVVQVEDDYPRLQRYALFVSLMNMTEINVVKLCKTTYKIFNLSKVYDDGDHNIVNKGLLYLKGQIGIKEINSETFNNLRVIRNCIVHADGTLTHRKDAQKIQDFVKNRTYIKIGERNKIILEKGFIEESSKEMHIFLNDLMNKIFRKYREFLKSELNVSQI